MKNKLPNVLKYIFLYSLALIVLLPFLYAFLLSMKSLSEFGSNGLDIFPKKIDFSNYKKAWVVANFARYTMNTAFLSIVLTIINTVFVSMAAFAYTRLNFFGKKPLIVFCMAFIFISFGSATLYPLLQIAVSLKLTNSLLGIIIIEAGAPISNVLIVASYVSSISKEVDESAIIDGCGIFRRWISIMVPLSKPILATQIILFFRAYWNDYLIPLVFTFASPNLRTLTVGMTALKGSAAMAADWPSILAGTVISMAPMLVVYIIFQRYFVKGITEGAVKL